jgi:hypothetical protein
VIGGSMAASSVLTGSVTTGFDTASWVHEIQQHIVSKEDHMILSIR